MGVIVINGKRYSGSNVSVVGNRVIIDGVEQHKEKSVELSITITGGIERLEFESGKAEISGSVGNITTQAGDVHCKGGVCGSISTMSGDVVCGNIGGSVSTMSGDIATRKRNAGGE